MRFAPSLAALLLFALTACTAQHAPDHAAPLEAVTVYFDWDRTQVTPEAADTLDKFVARLEARPWQRLLIEGHTDTARSTAYSVGLSERQANSVKDYLIHRGIAPAKIATIAYGSSRLAVPTRPNQREPRNRRAVIRVE